MEPFTLPQPPASRPPAPDLDRPNLLGMRPPDLEAWLEGRGIACRPEHARRLIAEVVRHGRSDPAPRRPVPKRVLREASEFAGWQRPEVVERVTDEQDGFVKYLFRHPDGAFSEAVRIPLHKEGRYTVCLSSQVGCAMGCTFCATGRLGLTRNLRPWEMVGSFLTVRDEAPGRVTGAVFQGQGEPLHNYDAVIQAARVLCEPCGGAIAAEAITISTVGLVPQIRRFTKERHKFRLIVSLTSAQAAKRKQLLPVAGCFDLAEVADAIAGYAASTGRPATVAWVTMAGVNADEVELDALAELFAGVPIRLNIIDVNATDGPHRPLTDGERGAFLDGLSRRGIPFVRRYSGGKERHAACGMLASSRQGAERASTRQAGDDS